jgi:malto-oligosyltrehalose trehalohydrolase
MPFGAETSGDGAVRFRLWAPAARRVALCLETASGQVEIGMTPQVGGWFELLTDRAAAGSLYSYRVDGSELRVPDPASRFQPRDVHGPSEVIDPAAYEWNDAGWRGRPWGEAVCYELHVGAFTPAGSFAGVRERLDYLVRLGITAIELMPVADFPGKRNWGYDGTYPFAPDSGYGRPEELKALVDAAHARGLMALLDVVYNHFGPEGNYLHLYAPAFFTERHRTPWGAAVNFDGEGSRAVRDFFIHNALYWLEEFHFDGLRLDAVHAIADDSSPDILRELAQAVAVGPGRERHVHLVLENDANAARYLERDAQLRPRWYVAQWNDDLHHALHLLCTGETDGYYEDYAQDPRRYLGRALAEGFGFQGEPSTYRGGRARGEPSAHLPPTAFVSFLQTHDQVGNRAFGERLARLAPAQALRAATAVVLLAPSPPLLFMGEEWGCEQPFPFFCDFGAELAAAVTEGRRSEFARFPAFRDAVARSRIPDPNDVATFAGAVLRWDDLDAASHAGWLNLYRELLALRASAITPRLHGMRGGQGRFRALAGRALEAGWTLGDGSRLTLLTNLGAEPAGGIARPAGEPLYATPDALALLDAGSLAAWSVVWCLGPVR